MAPPSSYFVARIDPAQTNGEGDPDTDLTTDLKANNDDYKAAFDSIDALNVSNPVHQQIDLQCRIGASKVAMDEAILAGGFPNGNQVDVPDDEASEVFTIRPLSGVTGGDGVDFEDPDDATAIAAHAKYVANRDAFRALGRAIGSAIGADLPLGESPGNQLHPTERSRILWDLAVLKVLVDNELYLDGSGAFGSYIVPGQPVTSVSPPTHIIRTERFNLLNDGFDAIYTYLNGLDLTNLSTMLDWVKGQLQPILDRCEKFAIDSGEI